VPIADGTNDASAARDQVDLAARVRQFQLSGDVADLWPGVTGAAVAAARVEIERVIRELLRGTSSAPVRLIADDRDARVFSCAAFACGAGALLGFWIEQQRVTAPAPLAALLLEQLSHNRQYAARVERDLAPVLDAFAALGIAPLVIKGAHTARTYWDDVGVRPIADVDVVVPVDRIADAERALTDVGFEPRGTALDTPYKRDWVPPDGVRSPMSIERPDARNPWQIDLHVSLDQDFGCGAFARLDGMRASTSDLVLAGRHVLAPVEPLTLLLLATHAARHLDSMRLFRIIEIIEVIRRDTRAGRLDWEQVIDALRVTQSAGYAYPLLHLAEQLVPGTVDPHVLQLCASAAPWGVRHTVRRMVPSGASAHHGLVREFMWARHPADLARRVVARARARDALPRRKRWMRLARRALDGLISIGAPDERAITSSGGRAPRR